ncbi:MAG: type I polyketide synthase, partial [Rhodospirillales bacterium]|nr:type I polyketide synthase [Rhodospirillales bacterium]
VPRDRWDLDAFYDPDPDAPGKTNARWGGFLADVDAFDAALFGIARREAEAMDPQQRLLLEVTWRALEHAGVAPDGLTGSKTGVFVGLSTSDYGTLMGAGRDASWIDAYASLGNAASIAAGRIAYAYGLQGPAMVVDSACSSSLTAVHLAVQALRAGECAMALAAGVNLTLAPELTINFTKARMLAADGRCKTFDAAADGYVRAEGCGVLVLKRLADAEAAGDRVLAVIRAALANAGLAPETVDVVEAHGTGTALGDPIEMHALASVFGGRTRELLVGSVKTNIGHAEAAAGVAGLVKAVLMLRHQAVPPTLHFERLNPHIDLGGVPVSVPTALIERDVRVVGVSSFGFSGTNAHVVLERAETARAVPVAVAPSAAVAPPVAAAPSVSWPGLSRPPTTLPHEAPAVVDGRPSPAMTRGGTATAPGTAAVPSQEGTGTAAVPTRGGTGTAPGTARRPVHALPLSARDPAALEALVAAWSETLADPAADFAALCHTAGAGRARFAHRLAIVAPDAGAARTALATAPRTTAGKPRVAFLCTGQGSTYAGMAAGLAETSPVFRDVLERCDAVMGLDRPLAALFQDAAALARTDIAQPALYAVSAGLGALWRSWGIEPVAVLGHSVGEYAAAQLAGVLTLEDGARLIAARGRLMQALPAGGAMAALLGPEAEARGLLARHPEIEIAGLNAPTAMTVAGPEAALDRLLADPALGGGTLLAQKLPLRHAFHSRLLEPMLDGLAEVAGATPHHAPLLPVVGNVDGSVVGHHDAAYWRAHARQPVRFAAGLATLRAMGCTHVVELGAQPVLSGFARTAAPELVAVASLVRPRPGGGQGGANQGHAGQGAAGHGGAASWQTLLEAAARLWRDGAEVAWGAVDAPFRLPVTDAPGLAFRRQRYWFQTQPSGDADGAARPAGPERAALTGSRSAFAGERIPLATGETLFRNRLDVQAYPFLADHVVLNETIVPGASHVAMLLAASGAALRDVVFAAPLQLPELGCDTQVMRRDDRVELHADTGAGWALYAAASVVPVPPVETIDRAVIAARCVEDPDGPAALHAMLAERGIALGPTFRGIRRLFRGSNEALVEVALPDGEPAIVPLHPAQLDACFQALGATFTGGGVGGAFLPLAIDQVTLHRSFHGPLWAHVQARDGSGDVASGDVTLFDAEGGAIATVTGLTIKRVGAPADPSARWTYRVVWTPQPDDALTLPAPAALAESAAAARDA